MERSLKAQLNSSPEQTQYGFRMGESAHNPSPFIYIFRKIIEKNITKRQELCIRFMEKYLAL